MKEKKQIRNRWLHIRLNDSELQIINSFRSKTTNAKLSDYARKILLQKPVIVRYRNQSADELLAVMIQLKNELRAIGHNYNQAIHRLHTLQHLPDIRAWVITHEKSRDSFLQKTEDIKITMNKIYESWSQK